MKSKLLKKTRSYDNLDMAWRLIRSNARSSGSEEVKNEVKRFDDESGSRLRSMQHQLSRGKFQFRPAKGVPIAKHDSQGRRTGKIRPIVLAPIESRIVQRALLNVLVKIPSLKRFLENPFSFGSCRKVDDENLVGVPAAIAAALDGIGQGAEFYASADIKAFFTRVPKPHVLDIISSSTGDDEFMRFLAAAVTVELSNMAQLRRMASEFPIEEIGVAQGSSLSPFLGNIALAAFDSEMNDGDSRCLRYVDDFLILGKSEREVNQKLRQARRILRGLGMELSAEKSSKGARHISQGFEFLGIDVSPGLVRPSRKAQRRLLDKLKVRLDASANAYQACRRGEPIERRLALLETLRQAAGIVDGWAKHYRFCNDGRTLEHMDGRIDELLRSYLGAYSDVRGRIDQRRHRELLGISNLKVDTDSAFDYPQTVKKIHRCPKDQQRAQSQR